MNLSEARHSEIQSKLAFDCLELFRFTVQQVMNTSKDSKDNTRRSIGMDEVCVFPQRKTVDGQSAKRIGFRKPLTLRLEQLEPLYCKLE